MSETLRDLVVSLSLNSDNFTRNIKSVNKQIQEAESYFKLASAGVENFENSAVGLQSKLDMLERKLSLQNDVVGQYERALTQASSRLQECYDRQNDYAQRLEEARTRQEALRGVVDQATAAYNQYKDQLGETDSVTIAAKANMEAAQQEYREASDEVQRLAGQNDALRRATQNAADAVSTGQKNLNAAQAAVRQTEAQIRSCNQELALAQTQWNEAGERIKGTETAITSIGKQIQLAESRFKLASAGIKDVDTNAGALSAKLTMLQEKLTLQQQAVGQYEEKLRAAKEQLQAAQQANDPEKIRQATDAVTDAEAALNRAKAAVKETQTEIRETNQALRTAQSEWTALGKSLESFSKYTEKVSQVTGKMGRVLTTYVTAPILSLGATAMKASIDFESAFTGVRKTVDASEEEFAHLASTVKRMSTEIASDTTEIADVMAIAGQLGIHNDALESFTRTMIDLGNTTDIVASEAGSTLAKFANIMGMDQSLFQNLGSTLVDLGNNYATTESSIMQMSLRLAGAGKQVGLSEAQILGFATALSSVGIEAQMGGSAFSKALVKMEVASATGDDALKDFSKICGLTGKEFQTMWAADPAAVFQLFIEGLARMDDEGMSAIAVLNDIGISEVRLRDTLLRSVNATELFSATQKTATKAWKQNTALTEEANKRYATTESKLINLKNKAMLFAQTLGDDLNPMIQNLVGGADGLIDKFMNMDAAQRQQLMKTAAIVASVGPTLLVVSKVSKGLSVVTGGIGKFATAVGKAGGGFSGFLSVLGKSPLLWTAVAVAAIAGTVALVDYASGAKQAREALEGMNETAKKWKETAAETFYSQSNGLSFFGMSKDDFIKHGEDLAAASATWLSSVEAEWSNGKWETNQIIKQYTEGFTNGTATVRNALQELQDQARQGGYSGLSEQMQADLATLDSMDKEIARLLKRRQGEKLYAKDKVRLQELIDTRNAIVIRYNLLPDTAGVEGFETIRKKLEAEVARAQAKGQSDAAVSVYENAVVAAGEGMAAVNAELDTQYDKEFALIQLMNNEAEKQAALTALNQKYNESRKAGAEAYAALLKDIVLPVWKQEDIQKAGADIDALAAKLAQFSATSEADKPAILEELNQLSASMDESALIEYIGLLTQIQSLMDSGMSQQDVSAMFPEMDFSKSLEQIAAIQAFLKDRSTLLPGLASMFSEAVPEEMIKLSTDLDMTGAQARWDEFAANPGAITTAAIISGYEDAENVTKPEVVVSAFISQYTEVAEGANKAQLTPTGLIALVSKYAEVTTGADVSGLTPQNVTAFVKGYQELAAGTDVSLLKPSEIVAYVSKYAEKTGVDISGLKPETITAFVMAYQEITGGALTTSLTPTDIAAMVTQYLLAEKCDMSKITDAQVNALVNAYAEATNCDKSKLKAEVVAQITEYVEAENVKKPSYITTQISITGYDLRAYRDFVKDNPVEVAGIVRLNSTYENPADALFDPNAKFWRDGVEVPAEMVTSDMLTPEKVAVLSEDGTMHVLLTPELTGGKEVLEELREEVAEADSMGWTAFGRAMGMMPVTVMDRVNAAVNRLKSFEKTKDYNFIQKFWASLMGESTDKKTLDTSMQLDFDPGTLASITTYVSEMVTAIKNGDQIAAEDYANLQKIVEFLNGLELDGVGENVTAGIGEAMAAAGWEANAQSTAANLESALNAALVIQSPSQRMHPVGENVAAGIGEGMTEYDFTGSASAIAGSIESAITAAFGEGFLSATGSTMLAGLSEGMTGYSFSGAASTIGSNARSAVSASLNSTTLRSAGVNAMAGLRSGIVSGQSGVVSAMRTAARAAVNAAKTELKIKSPSGVFRDEVGRMAMRGWGEGIEKEAKAQAKTISNAARYLTEAAKESAISPFVSHESKTYNNTSSVNFSGSNFYIRDEQDIYTLASEIAVLTRREQRGRGLRMA